MSFYDWLLGRDKIYYTFVVEEPVEKEKLEQKPIDVIRAKVEETKTTHFGPVGAHDECGNCGMYWPCDARRWAEAALKLSAFATDYVGHDKDLLSRTYCLPDCSRCELDQLLARIGKEQP